MAEGEGVSVFRQLPLPVIQIMPFHGITPFESWISILKVIDIFLGIYAAKRYKVNNRQWKLPVTMRALPQPR